MRLAALILALPAALAQSPGSPWQKCSNGGMAGETACPTLSTAPLKLSDLISEALRRNPEILAAQKKYEAARQKPAQERALPDPVLSMQWDSVGNPLPYAGVGTYPIAYIGMMASQTLPAPGKLRLRGEIASEDASAEAQSYRAVELNVISRVKQAYFRLHHAWVMQEILGRNLDILRSLLHVSEARYSVGKVPQADVFKVQTQITLLETRLMQVDQQKRTREAEINSLVSEPPDRALPRPPDLMMEPIKFTLAELLSKTRGAAPSLARDQKRIERAGVAVNLAKKDYLPDLTLSGGYFYMGGSMPPMYSVRADINVPLHFGKTRAEVTQRSEEESQAKHDYEATARTLEYRIRESYFAAETAQKLLDMYNKVVIPQADLAVQSSLAAYQTGGADLLSVLNNELSELDYQLDYHEQMQSFLISQALLEEMTGVELLP